MDLLKYNRHWEKGFRFGFIKKREVFPDLLSQIQAKQIVELAGLRRTGKTTLMFQLIDHLLDQGVNPFSVWYYTFDEDKAGLDELLSSFSQQAQVDLKKEKIYIFLDEIQKLPDFQNKLKVYYDLYPNLKFFISGSTSLFIKKKIQESLAGRIVTFLLLPLNFTEYLNFRDKAGLLEKRLAFRAELEREFETFLESQFIEAVNMEKAPDRKAYFVSIIRKIIFEDVPRIFPVDNPEILWRLTGVIGQNPGICVDYRSLAGDLGVSNKTVSLYLFYLEEAFLVKKLFNFSRNMLTSERKLKKFYLASPSFSWAVSDFSEKGKLAENLVASLKDYRFFWRDPYQHEVDFVDTRLGITPVEVKYRNEIKDRELRSLVIFSRKFKADQAFVLSKAFEDSSFDINGLKIQKRPIYFY